MLINVFKDCGRYFANLSDRRRKYEGSEGRDEAETAVARRKVETFQNAKLDRVEMV
jgi:hypothetical protein